MKKLYGFLFVIIGLFNMYIGFVIYDSDYYEMINFFSELLKNSQNYFPLIVFVIGLIYFFIGIGLIFRKRKSNTKSKIFNA